jgi:hypothetical protein
MSGIDFDASALQGTINHADLDLGNGNLRDAYNAYISAAQNLISFSNGKLHWTGQRVNPPSAWSDSLVKARKCLEMAEKCVELAITPTELKRETLLGLEIPKNHPVIPTSPLHHSLLQFAHAHRLVERKLAEQRMKNPGMSTQVLRRLIEDVRIEKDKVDTTEDLIKSMNLYSLESFEADYFAKQLTVLDLVLMKPLNDNLPQTLLQYAQRGRGTVALDRFCHFQKYLASILTDAILTAQPDPNPTLVKRGSVMVKPTATLSPASARARMIQHVINILKHLLQKYNNHASAGTLVSVLTSLEITRLRRTWPLVDPSARDVLERIKKRRGFVPLDPRKDDEEETIGSEWDGYLVGELLEQASPNSQRWTIIPWLQGAVLRAVEDIWTKYGTSQQIHVGHVPLTPLGKRRFDLWISGVESALGLDRKEPFWTTKAAEVDLVSIQRRWDPNSSMEPRPKLVAVDVSQLIADASLQHWILTRVFRTRQQLWQRSQACEPAKGILPVPVELLRDDGEVFDPMEEVVEVELAGCESADAGDLALEQSLSSNPPIEESTQSQTQTDAQEGQEISQEQQDELDWELEQLEREYSIRPPLTESVESIQSIDGVLFEGVDVPGDASKDVVALENIATENIAREDIVALEGIAREGIVVLEDVVAQEDIAREDLIAPEDEIRPEDAIQPVDQGEDGDEDLGTLQGSDDEKTVLTTLDHMVNPSPAPLIEDVQVFVPVAPDTVRLPASSPFGNVGHVFENVWEDGNVPLQQTETQSESEIKIDEEIKIESEEMIVEKMKIDSKNSEDELNDLLSDMNMSNKKDSSDEHGYQTSPLWQRLAMLKPK